MKLVSFEHAGKIHYGAVKNGRVIDLSARLGGQYPDIISFIAHDGKQVAQAIIAESNGDYDYDQLNLLSVIPNPGKILCVGLNYHDHVTEANNAIGNRKAPDRAMIFARWPESLTGHRKPILRPKVSQMLDWVDMSLKTKYLIIFLVMLALMRLVYVTIKDILARLTPVRILKKLGRVVLGW
jgi:hypothetical protein